MQISSRFTMAVQTLTCIEVLKNDIPMNSETIAASVGTNPVAIRNLFQKLKAAGLIEVQRGGNGGVALARPMEEITLLDVYRAVENEEDMSIFRFHANPNANCPVGRNIHHVMDGRLTEIQAAMEEKMAEMTLADVIADTEGYIAKEPRSGQHAYT